MNILSTHNLSNFNSGDTTARLTSPGFRQPIITINDDSLLYGIVPNKNAGWI
jgi:hypothetical protein